MSVESFKIGDRVDCFMDGFGLGVVKGVSNDLTNLAIELDNKPPFCHDCEGRCKMGYGYWACNYEVKHVQQAEPFDLGGFI